jgi:hypothetical protein
VLQRCTQADVDVDVAVWGVGVAVEVVLAARCSRAYARCAEALGVELSWT